MCAGTRGYTHESDFVLCTSRMYFVYTRSSGSLCNETPSQRSVNRRASNTHKARTASEEGEERPQMNESEKDEMSTWTNRYSVHCTLHGVSPDPFSPARTPTNVNDKASERPTAQEIPILSRSLNVGAYAIYVCCSLT